MNNLFETPEAEAARQLFYFMAGREGLDEAQLEATWMDAGLGADAAIVRQAVRKAVATRTAINDDANQERWSFYSLQRQYLTFIEDIGLHEDAIPGEGGEVVFYNLGKFSQLISDFESIHYHSDPIRKYDEFANFLQHRADSTYPEGWQDNQYANPNAVRGDDRSSGQGNAVAGRVRAGPAAQPVPGSADGGIQRLAHRPSRRGSGPGPLRRHG